MPKKEETERKERAHNNLNNRFSFNQALFLNQKQRETKSTKTKISNWQHLQL